MKKFNNIFNNRVLKQYRIFLRNNSTSAESTLWNYLKNKQLGGRKFRRQYSIGNFIADFCCPSEKLIIELDGAVHGGYSEVEKDIKRDQYLQNLGFTVLRFENRFVFQDPEYVISEIIKCFHSNTVISI